MSQEVTLGRRATLIRKSGILYPENPNDVIARDALESVARFKGTTTNATQTELFIGGTSTTRFTLDANTSYAFFIRLVGQRVGGSQVYHSTIEGTIKRVVAVGTTAFVGDPLVTVVSGDSLGWDSTVSADTTNGALALKVTGLSSTTIHWVAELNCVEAV